MTFTNCQQEAASEVLTDAGTVMLCEHCSLVFWNCVCCRDELSELLS